jgi:hypothetical protein
LTVTKKKLEETQLINEQQMKTLKDSQTFARILSSTKRTNRKTSKNRR